MILNKKIKDNKMFEIDKKKFNFEDVKVGDYIKFKINNFPDKTKKKYSIYYSIVTEVSKLNSLGVQIDQTDERMDFPLGLTIHIDRRSVLQIYPSRLVKNLSLKLSLKHLWKNLIFREVKTTKCQELKYIEHRYIAPTGFENIVRYASMEEARNKVKDVKNLIPIYSDFFGFTMDKKNHENDKYDQTEIFFSKKCYCEIDWSVSPTADFSIDERGELDINPKNGDMICGIAENGEKGLFYRKWFMCSKEFQNLWNMVMKQEIKDIQTLDTSKYLINFNHNITKRKENYQIYNLEKAALYYPSRYKQVAQLLLNENLKNKTIFQKNLKKNLTWAKKVV